MADSKQPIDFLLLWKKIHSKLTLEEEEKLDTWLSESSRHREYFKSLQNFYLQDAASPSPEVDKAWEKVSRRLHQQDKKMITWRLVTGIAASLLLLFSAWYFFPVAAPQQPATTAQQDAITPGTDKALLVMDNGAQYDLSQGSKLQLKVGGTDIQSEGTDVVYKKETIKDTKPVFNTLKVPRGGQFKLTLSDGTRVWLNAASTLRYPVYFSGSERKVTLTGEAYFEVSKNKKIPFRIQSQGQTIEVLGTAFNISSYPDDSLTATTLVEGKVKVFVTARPDIQTSLLPGSQSLLPKGKQEIKQHTVDTRVYTAWKDGKFVFVDQPLKDMMKTLARWYDVEVVFTNEKSKNLSFTGDIERYKDFEKILFLIEKTNEVSFKIKGRRIVID